MLMNIFDALRRSGRKLMTNTVAPITPFNFLRISCYRMAGFKVGKRVFIGMHCYLDDTHPHRIIIEDDVTVSFKVVFAAHGPRTGNNKIILRKGCYIGAGSIILGGLIQGDIEIREYATVGAGSLVNKSVAPLATVAGVPCKLLRTCRPPWESDDGLLSKLIKSHLLPAPDPPLIHQEPSDRGDSFVTKMNSESGLNGKIHFSTDGSDPTEDSPVYSNTIEVKKSTLIKARFFSPGYAPSSVSSSLVKGDDSEID